MLKITIQTDADFTPKGKRRARIIPVNNGRGRQLRWYVGGKIFRFLAVTNENIALTREWVSA